MICFRYGNGGDGRKAAASQFRARNRLVRLKYTLQASRSGTPLAGTDSFKPLHLKIKSGGAFIVTKRYDADVTAKLSGDGGLNQAGRSCADQIRSEQLGGITQAVAGTLF